jgi:hypothetical protein
VGTPLGKFVGDADGDAVGELDGDGVFGELLGVRVGASVVGAALGRFVGGAEGDLVGDAVIGLALGETVGDTDGLVDGDRVGHKSHSAGQLLRTVAPISLFEHEASAAEAQIAAVSGTPLHIFITGVPGELVPDALVVCSGTSDDTGDAVGKGDWSKGGHVLHNTGHVI